VIQGLLTVHRKRRGAALTLAALVAAGCVGASETAPGVVSPAATLTAVPSAPAAASPTAEATVAATPAGPWRSIAWTAIPATDALGASLAPDSSALPVGSSFQVFGWSGGFVGFTIIPNEPTAAQASADINPAPTVVASYSADGVHWHAGRPLAAGSPSLMTFRSVIEGPAGLLALGFTGACGDEYLDSMWMSKDGVAWEPVDVAKAFGVGSSAADRPVITHVSGGGAGYVAVAYKSAGAWTSIDGRTWSRVALDTGAFQGARIDDGTALSGAFVLGGTYGTRDCAVYIGATPVPATRTAAAWWSADGSTWTRATLPGAVASTNYQSTWTIHVDDHAVMVVSDIDGVGTFAWGSNDGRTWAKVEFPVDVFDRCLVTAANHNLVVGPIDDPSAVSELRLRTIDDHFALTTVSQNGDVPKLAYQLPSAFQYGLVAVGPTGVVVSSGDGSRLWFGSPSTN
jgi:hypothetical protein